MRVKCTSCNYTTQFDPISECNYKDVKYRGCEYAPFKFKRFPAVKYYWCKTCQDFTPVETALSIDEIHSLLDRAQQEVVRQSRHLFPSRRKLQAITSIITEYSMILALAKGKNRGATCTRCGGSNILRKDIHKELWCCPSCGVGRLYVSTDRVSYPVLNIELSELREDKPAASIYDIIADCAVDLLRNEYALYIQRSDFAMGNIVKNYKWAVTDRVALILSSLKQFSLSESESIGGKVLFALIKRGTISANQYLEYRLKGALLFFKDKMVNWYASREFKFEHRAEIISVLLSPSSLPHVFGNSHFFYKHNIEVRHWQVVLDTINAYMKSYKIDE